MTFVNFEERFYEDAKNTELGFAKVRVKTARVKGAFFGSKLAIARLVLCVLPVASLLLPIANVTFHFPMFNEDFSIGLLGVINIISNNALSLILEISQSDLFKASFSGYIFSLAALLVCALFALLCVLMTILCFISVKKCAKAVSVFSALGIISSIATAILSKLFINDAVNEMAGIVSGKMGFGVYLTVICFIAVMIANLILSKKGVDISYREGDLYRVETAKKIRRGELKLSEIPYPIFETDEERDVRLKEEEQDSDNKSAEEDTEHE